MLFWLRCFGKFWTEHAQQYLQNFEKILFRRVYLIIINCHKIKNNLQVYQDCLKLSLFETWNCDDLSISLTITHRLLLLVNGLKNISRSSFLCMFYNAKIIENNFVVNINIETSKFKNLILRIFIRFWINVPLADKSEEQIKTRKF